MNRKKFQQGMRDGIPICLGYFAVSFTFGMMAVGGGLSIWQAVLISLTNLTSAGQFAGLNLIFTGAPYYEMALTQLVINLRYCLMSFSLSQKVDQKANPLHRFFMAHGVTDEIFGISSAVHGDLSPWYMYGAMSVAIPGWTCGTLLGAISGNLMPDFIASALGIAIYGMFLAIVIPASKSSRTILAVVVGAMILSGLFSVVPGLKQISSGFVIIIVTVLVAAIAAWLRPIQEVQNFEQ